MKHPLTSKQATAGILVLLERLDASQGLLAQIVNDPENRRNGAAAAAMFRENAEMIEIVKGRLK
jgi:hypothetical protein